MHWNQTFLDLIFKARQEKYQYKYVGAYFILSFHHVVVVDK